MSWYVGHESVLTEVIPKNDWWKTIYQLGEWTIVSAIYGCTGCKREVTLNKRDRFPPHFDHQHQPHQGNIGWKLNVRANAEGE